MSLLDNFPHRVTILRPDYVQDADDIGNREVLQEIATDVHAWIQNASMREITEWQRRDEDITNRIGFNAKPDIEPGDKVRCDSGPSFQGDIFKYLASEDRSAGLGKFWSAVCEIER